MMAASTRGCSEVSETDLLSPAGRVVMISGASRGIGAAIAHRLASEGYSLSLGVRRPAEVSAKFEALDPKRLLVHQHTTEELAHYARAAFDIQFDFGGTLDFQEIEGVHNRGDFDLSRHQEFSGKKLEYFDQPNNRRYVPFVVETSVGADRTTLAVLVNSYRDEAVEGETEGRTVLGIHPALAPIKAGVFPLVKKDGMPEFAEKLAKELRAHFPVFYDESGAIGRRYRRQDEVGTPYCITVDGQTNEDQTVTLRDRDTLQQERVAADRVAEIIRQRIET